MLCDNSDSLSAVISESSACEDRYSIMALKHSSRSKSMSNLAFLPSNALKTPQTTNETKIYKGKFHTIHGVNIQLSIDRNTATCTKTDNRQRFVFSSRPIAPNEIIQLNVEIDSHEKEVSFGFGFTSVDPAILTNPLEFHEKYHKNAKTWTKDVPVFGDGVDIAYHIDDAKHITYTIGEETETQHLRNLAKETSIWAICFVRGDTTTVSIDKTTKHIPKLESSKEEANAKARDYLFEPMAVLRWAHINANRSEVFIFARKHLSVGEIVLITIEDKNPGDMDAIIFGVTSHNPSNLAWKDIPLGPQLGLNAAQNCLVIDSLSHHRFSKGDEFSYVVRETEIEYRFKKNNKVVFKRHSKMQQLWPFLKIHGNRIQVEMALGKPMNRAEPSRNVRSEENELCKICFESDIDSVLYECGHMAMCYVCSFKQWKTGEGICPLCRAVIKDVIRIYK